MDWMERIERAIAEIQQMLTYTPNRFQGSSYKYFGDHYFDVYRTDVKVVGVHTVNANGEILYDRSKDDVKSSEESRFRF